MNQDLKPKEVILKEAFDYVREEGRIPWINEEDGDEDHITVDEICIHGKSWASQYLVKDEESGLWEWSSSGEGDGICDACEPDCDCGKPHEQSCPICKAPWPKFSEESLIEARKNDEDLIHDTNCPKCGHAWTLSIEEMEKLHPEVLAEMEEDQGSNEDAQEVAKPRPIRNGRPIGRNSECPCGSGKKYKRCCESKPAK